MASTLPSPPTSREPSPNGVSSDKANLVQALDDLLEKYLEALDQYTAFREQLAESFSQGFLSLAHAQRTSNLGPGRRYGQDGYDGRMKARRRVQFSAANSSEYTSSQAQSKAQSLTSKPVIEHDVQIVSIDFQDLVPSSTDNDTKSSKQPVSEELDHPAGSNEASKVQNKEKVDPAYRDPVTWYGILVPPSLRQAQKCFSSAITTNIPELLTAMVSLRSMEAQIWKFRDQLGTMEQYPNPISHSSSRKSLHA